ncbi:hypothetical protein OA15_15635 [Vibrio vulnificus]|nr:hypothetical protein OA16_19935 [Vibrio vulnificus]KHF84246.1 hypothetical protein OA15_15635 [Vibrio vulnificus]KHF91082.1 hypothetical protein OA19_02720 [Vibrio vulnificus]KHF94408.1 hypothetical protein OA14_15280 [Vibrio vulnificus]
MITGFMAVAGQSAKGDDVTFYLNLFCHKPSMNPIKATKTFLTFEGMAYRGFDRFSTAVNFD